MRRPRVSEIRKSTYRLIGVPQFNVLADNRNFNLVGRVDDMIDEILPNRRKIAMCCLVDEHKNVVAFCDVDHAIYFL